jgi:hypothetical protein
MPARYARRRVMKRAYDQQSYQAQPGAAPPPNPQAPPNGQAYAGYNYYQPAGNAVASTSQQYNPAFPYSSTTGPAPGQPPLPPGAPPPAPTYDYSAYYAQQTGQTKLAQPQGPAQRPDPAFANYGYSASTQQAHQQAAQYPHGSMYVVLFVGLCVFMLKTIFQRSATRLPGSATGVQCSTTRVRWFYAICPAILQLSSTGSRHPGLYSDGSWPAALAIKWPASQETSL